MRAWAPSRWWMAATSFALGALVTVLLLRPRPFPAGSSSVAVSRGAEPAAAGDALVPARPAAPPLDSPRRADAPPTLEPDITTTGADTIADLRARHLTVPVRGVEIAALRSSFHETRDGTREHEALDILAPRHTPVIAVEDGVIARLFLSKAGGITVYQFDPTRTYAYYYAHLERYAPGLEEGQRVSRAQVLGEVGTSGNAPPNTPHLHFAIFKLTPEKQWWKGTAVDPFLAWREERIGYARP